MPCGLLGSLFDAVFDGVGLDVVVFSIRPRPPCLRATPMCAFNGRALLDVENALPRERDITRTAFCQNAGWFNSKLGPLSGVVTQLMIFRSAFTEH